AGNELAGGGDVVVEEIGGSVVGDEQAQTAIDGEIGGDDAEPFAFLAVDSRLAGHVPEGAIPPVEKQAVLLGGKVVRPAGSVGADASEGVPFEIVDVKEVRKAIRIQVRHQ